jgi:protein-disulfide isomerase
MICVIALIVFGILGIFSAKYRLIAKEALNCVFKKITLRKCDTGLDTRLKSQITGSFMRYSPPTGRFLYKYFEWFSWFFLILTLATFFFMGQGIYNYALYGNCNGPNSTAFCIFDPLGTNKPVNISSTEGAVCAVPGLVANKTLTPPPIYLEHEAYKGSTDAKVVVVEFGCFSCHYTKLAEPTVQKVIQKYGANILYIYKDFPLTLTHETALMAAEASHCALEQNKYWEYREYLFANQDRQYEDDLIQYATDLGLDATGFRSCLDSGKYKSIVEQNYQDGLNSGITVTPTFFINNQTLVGAVDYSQFHSIINKELGIPWWEFWR